MVIYNFVKGFILCFAWYFTILAGFFILYCPVLPIACLKPKLYQKIVDLYFELWMLYPIALFQLFYGTDIIVTGDTINANENAIIIMNHRTRVDWNFAWLGLHSAWKIPSQRSENSQHCFLRKDGCQFRRVRFLDLFSAKKARLKLVLKDEIKNIPGIGWIMQMNNFLYLKRNWSQDCESIERFLRYNRETKIPFQLLLFPEGTDFSRSNQKKSDDFARKNNLQSYDFVLHPRTRGFVTMASSLLARNEMQAVYDITIIYPGKIPQTEKDMLTGNIPERVFFKISRYSCNQLPNTEELTSWLNEKWREKENYLSYFHNHEKDHVSSMKENKNTDLRFILIAFFIWTAIDIIFLYGLLFGNRLFQFCLCFQSIFFYLLTRFCSGFHFVFINFFFRNSRNT